MPCRLALAAGLFEAVPVVGPALGALPAVAVALTLDPAVALGVLAATAAIQLLENTVLVPRVMRRAVGVSPVVTLLSLAAFGRMSGVPGALLAIPLAAVFQLLLDRFVLGPNALDTKLPAGRGSGYRRAGSTRRKPGGRTGTAAPGFVRRCLAILA